MDEPADEVVQVNRFTTFLAGTILARGTVVDESGRRMALVELAQDIGNPPTDEAAIAAARPLLAAKFAAGDCYRAPVAAPLAVVAGPVVEGWEEAADGRRVFAPEA